MIAMLINNIVISDYSETPPYKTPGSTTDNCEWALLE